MKGEYSMKRRKKLLLSLSIVALVVCVLLAITWVHSAGQLRVLKAQGVYANPEDGMRAQIASSYSGVSNVEIVHAGRELFDDLWYVEAHVWAESRSDGKGFSGKSYDNPGSFFLHVGNGWIFVPEGRQPEVIAFGEWLFGLRG
jgi:hypothetical protein